MGSSTNFASATAPELEKLGAESALGEAAERGSSRFTLPTADAAPVSKYAIATEPVTAAGESCKRARCSAGAKIKITAIVSAANTTAPVARRGG